MHRKRIGKVQILDKVLGEILNEVLEEYEDLIDDPEMVIELYKDYFLYIDKVMHSGHFPKIIVPKLGRFEPITGKLVNLKGRMKKDSEFKDLLEIVVERLTREEDMSKKHKINKGYKKEKRNNPYFWKNNKNNKDDDK